MKVVLEAGCLLLLLVSTSAINVSVSTSIDKTEVCPQDEVTFTCTVQNGRGLVWIAEPFITEKNQLTFIPNDSVKNITFISRGVMFLAVLTQSDPLLKSTLNTTASATTNGTVIQCIEPLSKISDNSTLQLQAPAPPSNLHYSVTSYGTRNVTGNIEWNSSVDSSVDNFTVTVSSLDGTTGREAVTSPLKHVTLNYNKNYTISIVANNCAGNSTPGVLLFMETGCDVPVQPVNGRFSGFTSAKVGSKVTYDCDDGLNLAGKRVAMCTEHRVWAPMGSEVMCTPSGTVLSTNTLNFNLTYSTTIPITTTTTTSSSQSLSVGVVAGIVVVAVLSLVVVILIASVTIFVLLLKKISKKSGPGNESGVATGNSYTAAEEIVELQEVHNSSVVPDTYSAVGHVQESTSMEVAGTYSSVTQDTPSNGVPTTYSSVVHVQANNGTTHHTPKVKASNKGMQYAEIVPTAFSSPPVALLMNTQNKVQYSTVDHISKAPVGPVTEPVISPIDRNIDAEQIQLQLVDVRPEWRKLGCAVGLPPQFLDEVHASYEQDKDRLAEVVYKWCSQVESIRWADVAAMCRAVGYSDLAEALDKAYQTGLLPVDNCNDPLPLTPSFKALPPPPIPPREARESSPPELPPPPTPDVLEGLIPPTDDCQFPPPLPQKPHTIKAPAPPPRPPRHF